MRKDTKKELNFLTIKLIDEYFDLKKRVSDQKIKIEKVSNKFAEIKSLAIKYKENKDDEINDLNQAVEDLKKEIEKNSVSYENMLDKTAKSLEEIIKKTGSPSKIQ